MSLWMVRPCGAGKSSKLFGIDRRNYYRLVYALEEDQNLPGMKDLWDRGVGIWNENKKRHHSSLDQPIVEMQQILNLLPKPLGD